MERTDTKTTDTWIERAKAGDESAVAKLLEIHTQRLLESIRAELGDRLRQRLESQDVMQQVYLDALTGIEQFVDEIGMVVEIHHQVFHAPERP